MFGLIRKAMANLNMPVFGPNANNIKDEWLITWDDLGVEIISNISKHEQGIAESTVNDVIDYSDVSVILAWATTIARSNSDRNYEIWMFPADDSINGNMLRAFFDLDADVAKNFIRKIGENVPY